MSEQDAQMWRFEYERVKNDAEFAVVELGLKADELASLNTQYDEAIRQAAMSEQDAESGNTNLNAHKVKPTIL